MYTKLAKGNFIHNTESKYFFKYEFEGILLSDYHEITSDCTAHILWYIKTIIVVLT